MANFRDLKFPKKIIKYKKKEINSSIKKEEEDRLLPHKSHPRSGNRAAELKVSNKENRRKLVKKAKPSPSKINMSPA